LQASRILGDNWGPQPSSSTQHFPTSLSSERSLLMFYRFLARSIPHI
jgi:hypothetical protein